MENLKLLKIGLLFAVFVEGFVGGFFPLAFRRLSQNNELILVMHAFAGGVFISVSLVHLLAGTLEKQSKAAPSMKFPIGITISACGFFLVLFVEKVIANGAIETAAKKRAELKQNGSDQENNIEIETSKQKPMRPRKYMHISPPEKSFQHDTLVRLSDGLTALLALSLHAAIAGVAIGVSESRKGTLSIFTAVAAHKAVAAFAVGIKLVTSGTTTMEMVVLIFTFSTTTPVGIAVGIWSKDVGQWAQLVIIAIAAGAFLFVGASELSGSLFDTYDVEAASEVEFGLLSSLPFGAKRALNSPPFRRSLRFFTCLLGFGILVIAEYYGKYE
jgi:zinc transporter 1/2/3